LEHGAGKFGWSLRLKSKDRILLYMTPQVRRPLLGVVQGDLARPAVAPTLAALKPGV